ncbi:MAG: hypothetical protein PUC11_02485 [Elusimicrobia bacterium]|nr:hypothetical protein [Elusimicrobiota bacterium]
MANENKVIIPIESTYNNKGEVEAKKGLRSLQKNTEEVNKASVKIGKNASGCFSALGSAIAKVGGAILGAKAVWDFFSSSLSAYHENVRSVNMLAAAYKNVGYTAAGAMEQAKAFASEMQSMTGIADEKFLDAQRTLANYKVVGTQAQEAIRAAYALSANQGMEFEAALMLIARAAVGSTSTLSRYGIVLDQNIKEGDKFEAVLKQINEQFGASAQAAMGDSISKVNALKENWGDFKENIGSLIEPLVGPVLSFLNSAIDGFTFFLGSGKMAFKGVAYFAVNAATLIQQAFFNALGIVGEKLAYVLNLFNKIPGVEIASAKGVSEWAQSMRAAAEEASRAQKANADDMAKYFSFSKNATEEQERQLKLNAEQVNGKRDLAQAAADVVAEEKKATEETEKRIEAIKRNAGVGARDTLSGWSTPEMENEQTRADSLSAGDMFSGQTAQFSGLQDIDFLEEQLAAQRDKKLEYLQAELGDTEEYEQAKNEVLAQFNTEQAKLEQQRAKQNQQTMGTIFSNLISLSSSSNKKLAAIGKAAGIAQATISTYQGAANALAQVPYPLNFAAAASVVAAGLMQVANIAGVELANGGLVKAVTGGVPAVIGEGGSDEAVLPLDNSRAMRRIGGAIAAESAPAGLAGAVTVNVNVTASGGLPAFLNELTEATQNGVTEALRYANVAVKAGNEQSGYSV